MMEATGRRAGRIEETQGVCSGARVTGLLGIAPLAAIKIINIEF